MAGNHGHGLPAQFGQSFSASGKDCASAPLRLADEQKACRKFKRNDYNGSVVVVLRGACTFWSKANAVQKLGAIGIIVVTDMKPVVAMPRIW